MPLTAKLGTTDSRPGNIVPGLGSARFSPSLTTVTPAQLVVEIAFPNNPIDLAGYRNLDLYDQPVSYWRMDNAATLTDQAGGGNTMTVEASPTLASSLLSGDSNQSTTFNGTSQDGVVNDALTLGFTTAMSLEAWVSFASIPGSTKVIAEKLAAFQLAILSTGKLQFSVRNGSTLTSLTSTTTLSTSTTYHVAAVYDGGALRIYLNGVQDASTAYSGNIQTTTFPFTVARASNSTASPGFRGESHASTGSVGTTLGLGTPTATVAGDYMLAAVQGGSSMTVTPPDGWTAVGSSPGSSGTFKIFTFGKTATSTDAAGGGFYVWTFSASASSFTGAIVALSGVGATPTGLTNGNGLASNTVISTTLTPAFDNTLVVGIFFGSQSSTWTETPGTERVDFSGMAVETTAVGASSLQTETGTKSGTNSPLEAFVVEVLGPVGATSYTALTLDEVSLWNVALTPAQVAAHYAAASVAPTALTWTDVSADVRNCRINRGRQYELDQMQAGTAQLLLKDTSRKYDPGNALGVNAGNVLPMRQIRIRALLNGNYYPMFRGYVERWESGWKPDFRDTYAEVNITAVDGFEPLSLTGVATTIPAGTAGASIGALLSRGHWPPDTRAIDTGAFNVAAITTTADGGVLSYIQTVAQGESGIFFIDASGNAVFHDKNHRTSASTSTTSQAIFSDVPEGGNPAPLPYTELVPSFDKDHITNDWHVADTTSGDHEASDDTSIRTYFRRTQQRTTELSATDATTMAAYLLAHTKDPGYRFQSIEVTPNNVLEVWLQALQREISDRITVHIQPVHTIAASQIAKDCWIEQVTWSITPEQPWRVSWQLSPAS